MATKKNVAAESTKSTESAKTPEIVESSKYSGTPLLHTLSSNSVKVVWDSEKKGYRVKTVGKNNNGLLKYVGLKNSDIVSEHTTEDIIALICKIEAKAVLLAKLYESD